MLDGVAPPVLLDATAESTTGLHEAVSGTDEQGLRPKARARSEDEPPSAQTPVPKQTSESEDELPVKKLGPEPLSKKFDSILFQTLVLLI